MEMTSADAAVYFKLRYPDGLRTDLLTRDKPLLEWMEHDTGFATAKGEEVPAPYLLMDGSGGTNEIAFSNSESLDGKSFLVPQRHYIQFGYFRAEVLRNASAGSGLTQFTNAIERAIDGSTERMGQELHRQSWRSNNGVRALVAAGGISGTSLTLANKEDAQLFEPRMRIQALAGTAFTALRDGGDFVKIEQVDTANGILIGETAWTGIAALAAGDGLIKYGDQNVCLDGVDAIVPVTRPTSGDSFHGVDRSAYWSRLGGVYVDASTYNLRNAFIFAMSRAKQEAGPGWTANAPFFIHPKNFAQLQQQVEGIRVSTNDTLTKWGVKLESIEVFGHTFIQDTFAIVDQAFMIPKEALQRATAGDQPYLEEHDGSPFHYNRQTGKVEFTLAHDGNIMPRYPNLITRVALPAVAT